MPVIKDSCEVIEDIEKRERIEIGDKPWCIMRFEEGQYFNPKESAVDPSSFKKIVESILSFGFELVGGLTDRGFTRRVYENLEEHLSGKNKVGFRHLIYIFFHRRAPPSGILGMSPQFFVFIPSISDPHEKIFLQVAFISKSEKQKAIALATKYNLKFYGEPSMPILYRKCLLDIDSAKKFISDVLSFFEEAGYAEI